MPRSKPFLATKALDFQTKVRSAPLLPGCYIYKNKLGKVLYVGKAKILRNRVKSYFSNFNRVEEKIRQMLILATDIDYVVADSEIEALIIESVLIKKYKPKYNSMLVDDKSYAYVRIDKVLSSKGEYISIPTITVTRDRSHPKHAEYFGPYPNVATVKRLLTKLRRIFPYCTSNHKVIVPARNDQNFTSKSTKGCFHYQINLCNGACAGLASRAEYTKNLDNIRRFFAGDKPALMQEFETEMKLAAKNLEYEKAARIRNLVNDIKYVGNNLHISADIDEIGIAKAKQAQKQTAIAALITALGFPSTKLQNHLGFRIECYDISNIQGTNAVGAMTVSVDGQAAPDQYRKFKIKGKSTPDDFAMMQEMLGRRLAQFIKSSQPPPKADQTPTNANDSELTDNEGFTIQLPPGYKKPQWTKDPSFSQLPDLIVIDGGKGQLSAAYKVLKDFRLENHIPVVGLAKREEEIFKVKSQFEPEPNTLALNDVGISKYTYQPIDKISEFEKVKLARRSEAMYLLQRVRDEAHRFGITFHRRLRSKAAMDFEQQVKNHVG